jgi:hypothetical protein
MNVNTPRILGALSLVLACAPLGCAGLFMAMAGGPQSEEDKAWLAGFAKNYNDAAAASKKPIESIEAYFNAVIAAHECYEGHRSQMQDGWPVETVDGKMAVRDAASKCAELESAIRKKGTSEEGCGYALLEVMGGQQHAGTTDWTTNVSGRVNADAVDRKGFHQSGFRQLVPCEKVPAKGNAAPGIWKKEHVKAAEEACEKGATIVYTGTDWQIKNVSSGDDRYLERFLVGECWYSKAPISKDFTIPPACGKEDDAPPEGAHACITAAGKLVVK